MFRLREVIVACSIVLGLLVPAARSVAADLLRVLPVADDVIMLHFRDGHIDFNGVRSDGSYEPQGENRVYFHSLLDVDAATRPDSYHIKSDDDTDYSDRRRPTHVGMKAKGTEFDSPFKEPPYLREYWVYVELPAPMKSGKTYKIHVGSLADNRKEYELKFDERRLRSPAIHVSQVGFPPSAPKHAYFSQWMGTFDSPRHPGGVWNAKRHADGIFHICDAETGEIRKTYPGLTLQKLASQDDPSHGNWTKADVYSLDFSDFTEPGRYVLVAERMGCSHRFEIGESVFWEAYRASMRALFLQRRGIVKQLDEFGIEYPRSHHPDTNEFVYGKVEGEGARIGDPKPVTGIWGWYADAGDWDAYPTHYVVPYTLLLLYDLKPDHFRDGDIGNRWKQKPEDPWIDEGANGLPDLLDEARWLIDFYRRARHELVRQGLGTGGVPGYVGRDADAHFQPSWNDRRVLYVSQESAEMAYAYAGAAAYLAHCLDKHQKLAGLAAAHRESAGWIEDAKAAFRWAEAQRDTSQETRRKRQLAVVCLYLVTGDDAFQAAFREEWQGDEQRTWGAWVSPTANMLASAVYLTSCNKMANLDRPFYEAVKASMVHRADRVTDGIEQIGFRAGGVEPGQWIRMNLITVPRTIFQAVAYEVTGEKKYLDSMHAAMAFVFGANQEGRSRLTGVGFDREQDVFVCDAWYLLDLNHKAYRNPIFPGYSAYGLLCTFDVGGIGSEAWARGSTLPPIDQWPLGEQRMRSRYSIAGSEFTIHQNHPWYVFATGYLLDQAAKPRPRFARPTVQLRLPSATVPLDQPVVLRVDASPGTERVEYYYDWHFAGESYSASDGFALRWDAAQTDLKPGDEVQITAIAYDRRGESSLPTSDGEMTVEIIGAAAQ